MPIQLKDPMKWDEENETMDEWLERIMRLGGREWPKDS
jgi:hypothetical protein